MSDLDRGGYVTGQGVLGDLTDDQGNLLLSSGLDGASGGFGPAMRRYITSGVYNGDFALAPPSADSQIGDSNPLPFWTFTQLSGSAITAESDTDTGSASGRILRFTMAAGAAGDDSYIEQIIPINSSRSRSFAYLAHIAFRGGPTVSTARIYAKAAWLANDGVTVVGTEAAFELATSTVGADTVYDLRLGPGTAGGFVPSPAESTAYYVRLRIGFKRHTEPTTTTESVSVVEAALLVGLPEVAIADNDDPSTPAAVLIKQSDVLYLIASGNGTPYLGLDKTDVSVQVGGKFVGIPANTQALVAATTISPSALVVPISATAPITLTATPTVANGTNGQIIVLVNVGANAITIQDQGTLGGSNLRLSTATFAMGTRDNITLLYNSTIGDWIEIARTNVI